MTFLSNLLVKMINLRKSFKISGQADLETVHTKKTEHLRRKFPLGGDPKFDRRVEIVITYINKI